MCGSWKGEEGVTLLKFIDEEGPALGLFLNSSKTKVWCPNVSSPSYDLFTTDFPDIGIVTGNGINVLGVPVGSPEYCEEQAKKRISKIEKLAELLVSLDNYHAVYRMFGIYISTPRVVQRIEKLMIDGVETYVFMVYDGIPGFEFLKMAYRKIVNGVVV